MASRSAKPPAAGTTKTLPLVAALLLTAVRDLETAAVPNHLFQQEVF